MSLVFPVLLTSGLTLGFGRFARRAADAAENLDYQPRGLKIQTRGGFAVIPKLAIVNTKPQAIWFDTIDLQAYYDTTALGSASYTKRTIVPGRGEAVIEVPIKPSLMGVVSAAFKAITGGGGGKITIKGRITAGAISVDVDEAFDLPKKK